MKLLNSPSIRHIIAHFLSGRGGLYFELQSSLVQTVQFVTAWIASSWLIPPSSLYILRSQTALRAIRGLYSQRHWSYASVTNCQVYLTRVYYQSAYAVPGAPAWYLEYGTTYLPV